jgi:hypothetical protein
VSLAGVSYVLTVVARCGAQFRGFAPYVASISETGVVAFQASLPGNRTGVFVCEVDKVRAIVESGIGPVSDVYSHPDINRAGNVTFYGAQEPSGTGVFVVVNGQIECVAALDAAAGRIGPLGPTMSEDGSIAYRAEDGSGAFGVHTWSKGKSKAIARADEHFSSFDGLPVVVDQGAVVFRSTSHAGLSEIYLCEGGELTCVVDSAGDFCQLGRFPSLNEAGQVAFVAERADGSSGAFVVYEGVIQPIAESSEGFRSFRGVLLPSSERPIFYATPVDGELGLYAGFGSSTSRILGVGDDFGDAKVSAFALNPVSANARGQLAICLALTNGQQVIVRADPV